ncbi:MCE family protein [Candidatus Dependentiae bacterium]|nr:MCE family protein [Candidatus Dependentiae bacterium]
MKQNKTAIVGLVILLSCVLFIFLIIIMTDWKLNKGLKFYVVFNFANGIIKNGPVMVSGVNLGKVGDIEFITVNNMPKVRIEITLDEKLKIKKDAKIYINQAGLMGEKYIEIDPGSQLSRDIVFGETLIGQEPQKIEEVIAGVMNVIEGLNKAIDGFNDVFVEKEVKQQLKSAIDNLSGAIKNVSEITRSGKIKVDGGLNDFQKSLELLKDSAGMIKKTISANHEKAGKMITDLSGMAESLNSLSIKNNGKINEIIDNVQKSSKILEKTITTTQTDLTEFSKKLNSSVNILESILKNKKESIESSIDNLNNITRSLTTVLANNEKEITKAVSSVSTISVKLDKTLDLLNYNLEALKTEKGLMGIVIHDKELGKNLKQLVTDLSSAVQYLKHHPGILLNKSKYVSPEDYTEFEQKLKEEEEELKKQETKKKTSSSTKAKRKNK